VVLDPFVGSGATPAVARKLGRRYIGFELSKDYCLRATERVAHIKEGDMLDPPEIQGT
jgi:DNA modification methylase